MSDDAVGKARAASRSAAQELIKSLKDAFADNSAPATKADVANIYASLVAIHEALASMSDLASKDPSNRSAALIHDSLDDYQNATQIIAAGIDVLTGRVSRANDELSDD